MTRITTITLNPTIDMSGEAEAVRPTRKTRMTSAKYEPGGGGINVARMIAILGGEAEALYLAGGEIGEFLDRLLAQEGIARRSFPTAGQTRIAFTVREQSTGLEYRFIPQGAQIHAQDLAPFFDAIAQQPEGYVIASGSLPEGAPDDTFARMADLARSMGLRFVLDSSGPGLRITMERSRAFLVKPSRGELEQLAGCKLDDDGIASVAGDLVARGAADYVAVTLGPDGALLASADGIMRRHAVHVRVRSAVGAGDSFVGAMVWALSDGRPAEEAFRFGIAAGAAAATTPGTQLCQRNDVFALFHHASVAPAHG